MAAVETGLASDTSGRVDVFADGGFDPRSGRGGWAFVAYRDGLDVASEFGGMDLTTNGAMELVALRQAAMWINAQAAHVPATIWSNSAYAVNGCNRWRHIWKNWGWRKKGPNARSRSRSIADAELWREIDGLLSCNALIQVAWCKGHSGIAGNEAADRLAEFGRSRQGKTA